MSGVGGSTGIYISGVRRSSDPPPNAGPAYLTVSTTYDANSAEGKALLAAVRQVPAPTQVLVTGSAQQNSDIVSGITTAFPRAALWIFVSTFVLLLLLTGSLLLPAKAVVLNLLSLSASFGALVWVFQEGHLGGLGTQSTGVIIATVPIMLFCSTFGLSMDYEVFLLSRFKEEWRRSAGDRAGNDEAVAVGIARSGRVITTAAAVMIVAFAGILGSDVAIIRMLGFGLTLAILVDVTLIRLLLVPAVMRLAGTWNWWAPGFLRPLLSKFEVNG